jgi:hypothetical protein
MELRSERELTNTRNKLKRLEALYAATASETGVDQELREIEMESMQRFMNQLREEISRYEAHQAVRG